MSFRLKWQLFVGAAVLAGLLIYRMDPRQTRLPFGSTDLSSVAEQLAELTPEDRLLVESYVKRSNGDVHHPAWADPDDPLTARTFGEAIALQCKWNEKRGVELEKQAQHMAERQARLEPLRAVVHASVSQAEILTKNEYQALMHPEIDPKNYAVDRSPVFVAHIRIENLGDSAVTELQGSLQAVDSQKKSYFPTSICWLDTRQEFAPYSETEIICASERASADHRDFVEDEHDRFEVQWEPRHIKFANGRELDSGVY